MKPLFSAVICMSCAASSAFADLVFSEYVEGSSYNKAIELLNTGSDAVDLSQYSIELYSNGNTTVQSRLALSGSLPAGANYVIANSQAGSAIQAVANIQSPVTSFNGDDVLLLKNGSTVVDRLGQLGSKQVYGKDKTLVRLATVTTGDADVNAAFNVEQSWQVYPKDTFEYLASAAVTPPVDEVALFCGAEKTLISTIQGDSGQSALLGQQVMVEAIVTASLQEKNQLSGFFLQEQDADSDNNTATSEGVFVYYRDEQVEVGDQVRLFASVDEFYGMTQLTDVQALKVCASNMNLPQVVNLRLPLAEENSFEAVESMRVQFEQTLTVNEVYNLGRYGEFLVADGRRFIPTDVALPGAQAEAIARANALNQLVVDDGISTQNPEPVRFPTLGLSADNSLRVGDQVQALSGVMNFSFGAFKLIPTQESQFIASNPRQAEPEFIADSDLRLASFNVLNFFNGDGQGAGFPTARGADTAVELERQTQKLLAAILAIDADLLGLMELENDGYDELSAIAELTAALNREMSDEQRYEFVIPKSKTLGDDAIAVGILYRPGKLLAVGETAVLTSVNSPKDETGQPLFLDQLNRPALTQAFQDKTSGEYLSLTVNHFKSKGDRNCDAYADCDVGQGAYSLARTKAAAAVAQWLKTNPTQIATAKQIIMGDLNAYSKEAPITELLNNSFQLIKPEAGYSYVFRGETGSLDHVLASPELAEKVINVQDWHINTDEPRVLDYNTEFKSPAQLETLFAPNPYRSSDHDPVIVDFKFNQPPVVAIKKFKIWRWTILMSESYDTDGSITEQYWTLGSYQIKRPWLVLSQREISRLKLTNLSLTVVDNEGASAIKQLSLTQ